MVLKGISLPLFLKAYYLNATVYHIVATPDVFTTLKEELAKTMPHGTLPALQQLEQLPYLTAVVLEGYRIAPGVTHRLQRVSPNAPSCTATMSFLLERQ